ncbi:MAG: hypothetical protein KF760_22845 [Candidatus Eremiobacteraeota bacterium]|nr:hypothetical protein [Candidatus Eremiobacteraeota bacterium]MCW5870199.1 hypothetical protein [Candidatus Eremiobacteraeota bacterium]
MRQCLLGLVLTALVQAQEVPRFALPQGPLKLARATHGGVFFDVAGPRSAFFGLENGPLEGWLYPLKVFQDFELSFRLEGYPVDILGRDIQRGIELHPEYTVLTYAHSAFTVRQILLCPRSQAALVSLLEVDSSLPMTITAQIRPRLRLMWPGALSTQYVSWDEKAHLYRFSEESGQASAVFGSPGARDLSTMPYQEEPKDTLLKLEIQVPVERAQGQYIPLVAARTPEVYRTTLQTLPALTRELEAHYRHQREAGLQLELPDKRLQQAYEWSLVGMDKGVVHDPLFKSPGLVAGFRTSGESERPGFAWFFGRDAMWTAMALLAQGDVQTTRTALDFLAQHQREDGKIPHEISQSAPLVDWFKKYAYAWASSDATPLYLIVQGELFASSGDRQFLARHWAGIKKAWQWSSASDTDGDGLKENTGFGHAWVEGGALYPAHQELYLQGVFLQAARHMKAMAAAMGDAALEAQAQAEMQKVQVASERTYWVEKLGHYAFATFKPRRAQAEPGPNRVRRQQRLDEMSAGGLAEEDTVLPAVPMMWGWLQEDRAQRQLDHMIGASMSTDWGARLLSNQSRLYDPLAYHYGSVWPLHRLAVPGRLPLRAPAGRLAGAGRQCRLDGIRHPRLCHRAAFRRLLLGLRAQQPPPDLVGGHGHPAAGARTGWPGGSARRQSGAFCAAAAGSLAGICGQPYPHRPRSRRAALHARGRPAAHRLERPGRPEISVCGEPAAGRPGGGGPALRRGAAGAPHRPGSQRRGHGEMPGGL